MSIVGECSQEINLSVEWMTSTVALIGSLLLITMMTGLFRVIDEEFVAEEDKQNFAPKKELSSQKSRAGRLQNIHRNSMEHHIPFIILSGVWEILCAPDDQIRVLFYVAYFILRCCFITAYWFQLSPHRTIIFVSCHIILLMCFGCCAEALYLKYNPNAPDFVLGLIRYCLAMVMSVQSVFYWFKLLFVVKPPVDSVGVAERGESKIPDASNEGSMVKTATAITSPAEVSTSSIASDESTAMSSEPQAPPVKVKRKHRFRGVQHTNIHTTPLGKSLWLIILVLFVLMLGAGFAALYFQRNPSTAELRKENAFLNTRRGWRADNDTLSYDDLYKTVARKSRHRQDPRDRDTHTDSDSNSEAHSGDNRQTDSEKMEELL